MKAFHQIDIIILIKIKRISNVSNRHRLTVPLTIEDFVTILTAFKDQRACQK